MDYITEINGNSNEDDINKKDMRKKARGTCFKENLKV